MCVCVCVCVFIDSSAWAECDTKFLAEFYKFKLGIFLLQNRLP